MTQDSTDQTLRISAKRKRNEKKGKVSNPERLQCQFVIPNKNRQCPLTRKSTEIYCAEHLKQNGDDVRIPCPIDPRHSIWEKDLKAHSKKCIVKNTEAKSVPWFKENYNCEPSESLQHDLKVDYEKWIPVVESIYSEYDELKLVQLTHDGVQDRMDELINLKHAIQQSSLISHLEKRGLLSHKINYIEFGSGRAELSRYILKSIIHKDNKASDFLLIDRSPTRMKLDSKMVSDAQEKGLSLSKIHRIKIDIKDLLLDNVIENEFDNGKNFVAVSKHLCGAATDLTIECIIRSKLLESRFQGMLVAMCCRHCCNYDMLSKHSQDYLQDRGFDREGFAHLMKFASWAVNGRRPTMKDTDGSDHSSGLNIKERETLGLKARRIIDESRRFTLQNKGFKVELCQYVDRQVSLENTCLIVTRDEISL